MGNVYPLTDADPGVAAFARLVETVRDVRRWLPVGVQDTTLTPPSHRPGAIGRAVGRGGPAAPRRSQYLSK
jgi:hypothetical protein